MRMRAFEGAVFVFHEYSNNGETASSNPFDEEFAIKLNYPYVEFISSVLHWTRGGKTRKQR